MKNKKNYKLLLSTLVIISAIFINVNHCQKTYTSVSLNLNDVLRVSNCQAEPSDDKGDEDPILYSPYDPNEDLTKEKYLELLRRQRF